MTHIKEAIECNCRAYVTVKLIQFWYPAIVIHGVCAYMDFITGTLPVGLFVDWSEFGLLKRW